MFPPRRTGPEGGPRPVLASARSVVAGPRRDASEIAHASPQRNHTECQLKILIYSRAFWPSIGGLETMMEILAEEFTAAGHTVNVVTQIASDVERDDGYNVARLPTWPSYMKLLRWADVCLCANVSLRGVIPAVLTGTPMVISHHGLYGSPRYFDALSAAKRAVTIFSNNIACSKAVQSHILGKSVVIYNTYRNEIFKTHGDIQKDLDIVFVGRLVSDKGVADLINALCELKQAHLRPRLSIVGSGPERPHLAARVAERGLGTQVTFTGIRHGVDLAKFIARHRVMAVPSRCAEGFGVVALEGIACGCVVVGTDLGGLPEAIGECGVTVPAENPSEMASALKMLLEDDGLRGRYVSSAPAHLARHSRRNVARSYLSVLESASLAKRNRPT
jgi:glycogen synthase